VTVNLSALQFEKGDVVQATLDALEQSGLPASRLELEITEAVLIGDATTALDILRRLHELGVQIALDDFGNAFASLSYLQSFAFDKIKIDRTFVRDIPGRADCVAIVEAVTSLAHNLQMDTVAEGIETREHFASVSGAGCDEAQGYFFSRPVPASQLSEVLALCRIKGLVSNHKAATHHRARLARRRRSMRARNL
jgi:EAL domain-containing protein (putative c-di-GMP-specific phosphodiesterase class I)